ncbi:hypothetical protein GCM10023258_13990 [Terrabacter aeriphilus]|uniref:Septum formation-related domain-containing protein n=1 Tax=Terrabacter aeriphilus TaxID=515662 RepID=A0ABP9J7N2_9MICO
MIRRSLGPAAALVLVAAAAGACVAPEARVAPVEGPSTTVVPGCPAVTIVPGRSVITDYTDFLIHEGVEYQADLQAPADAEPRRGREVFRVTCTFQALAELTRSELPPETEHSAGFVPAGSPVFEATGWPSRCRLAASHDGRWFVYLATVRGATSSTTDPCALGARPTQTG